MTMLRKRTKPPIVEAVKEEYPYRKEQGDFLRIIEMRGRLGTIMLCFGIAFLLVPIIMAGYILSDSATPKINVILLVPFGIIGFYWIRKTKEQIDIGMYYYTYVGRDEIRWGDMFQHKSVSVSELAKVYIDRDGPYMKLTLKNGKTFDVENRFLTDMDALYERIKLIDNIEVD